MIRRRREAEGRPAVNVKRVYRVMKAHGLLLDRNTGAREERRHEGRVACDNGERVRIAFTLDCCDREAIAWFEHYDEHHPHKALRY